MSLEDEVFKLEKQIKSFRVASNGQVIYPDFKTNASSDLATRVSNIENHFKILNFAGSNLRTSGNIKRGFTFESVD